MHEYYKSHQLNQINNKNIELPSLPKGKIIHTKLRPHLAKPILLIASNQEEGTELDGFFQRTISSTIEYVDGTGKRLSKGKANVLFQLTSADNRADKRGFGNSFMPFARHGFILQALTPISDPFFHYTFFGNEITVRSVVRSQQLSCPGLEQMRSANLYSEYDSSSNDADISSCNVAVDTMERLVGEKLIACAKQNSPISIKLQVCTSNRTMVLIFREALNEYRKVEHFHLELVQTPFFLVQADIRARLARYHSAHTQLQTSLSQLLHVVLNVCPRAVTRSSKLFVNSTEPPIAKSEVKTVQQHTDDYYCKILRTFCSAAEESVEQVALKTIPVFLQYKNEQQSTETPVKLVFTLYARYAGQAGNPIAFFATLHSVEDMFFHFTSTDITREAWRSIAGKYFWENNRSLPVSVSDYRTPADTRSYKVDKHIGFDGSESAPGGGVPGILLRDLVANVCDNRNGKLWAKLSLDYPSGYKDDDERKKFVKLPTISSPLDKAAAKFGISPSSLREYRRSIFEAMLLKQKLGTPPKCSVFDASSCSTVTWDLKTASDGAPTDPPLFRAVLDFQENIGLRKLDALSLTFQSTNPEIVKTLITQHLVNCRQDQDATQAKFEELMANLRRLSPVEYDKIVRRIPDEISSKDDQLRLQAFLGGATISNIPANVILQTDTLETRNLETYKRQYNLPTKSIRRGPFDDLALKRDILGESATKSKQTKPRSNDNSWFFQHLH